MVPTVSSGWRWYESYNAQRVLLKQFIRWWDVVEQPITFAPFALGARRNTNFTFFSNYDRNKSFSLKFRLPCILFPLLQCCDGIAYNIKSLISSSSTVVENGQFQNERKMSYFLVSPSLYCKMCHYSQFCQKQFALFGMLLNIKLPHQHRISYILLFLERTRFWRYRVFFFEIYVYFYLSQFCIKKK